MVNFKMTGFAGHNLEGVGFALSIDEAKDMLGLVKLSKKLDEVLSSKELDEKKRKILGLRVRIRRILRKHLNPKFFYPGNSLFYLLIRTCY